MSYDQWTCLGQLLPARLLFSASGQDRVAEVEPDQHAEIPFATVLQAEHVPPRSHEIQPAVTMTRGITTVTDQTTFQRTQPNNANHPRGVFSKCFPIFFLIFS